MTSERHAELIAGLESAASDEWGPRALLACLRKLRDGGPTEGRSVVVHDAWATEDGFRVVYDAPFGGPRVGVIRDRGTSVDWLDVYTTGDEPTPEEFGWEVADHNIGEPLGRHIDDLDLDADGLGWWGHRPLRRPGRRG
ncbi:hypothetical protein ACQXVK_14305 [Curtobacterium sp. AB451]|uniref:hypothetical protein n=1 Tax=unclassified Curtobacterium TaxID=257496 RepID=UPI003A80E2A0